jgi:hypothetical protein
VLHRIGAILYALWGALHLMAAAEAYRLAIGAGAGPIQGRLLQNAWHLAVFAVVALVVAIAMNWRNSRTGDWINLVAVSAADIGFVIFVVVPGYIAPFPGLLGPALWLLAVIFSTLGLNAGRR